MDQQRLRITKNALTKAKYVCVCICICICIWLAKTQSFIGLSIIDLIDDNFKRYAYPLACKRLKGSCTHDKLAEILHDSHSQYELKNSLIFAIMREILSKHSKNSVSK